MPHLQRGMRAIRKRAYSYSRPFHPKIMDLERIKAQLEESIAEIDELKSIRFNHPRYGAWKASVYRKLERAWGKDSSYYGQFDDIYSGPFAVFADTPDSYYQARAQKKERQILIIN